MNHQIREIASRMSAVETRMGSLSVGAPVEGQPSPISSQTTKDLIFQYETSRKEDMADTEHKMVSEIDKMKELMADQEKRMMKAMDDHDHAVNVHLQNHIIEMKDLIHKSLVETGPALIFSNEVFCSKIEHWIRSVVREKLSGDDTRIE
jgi:hypothetical protein